MSRHEKVDERFAEGVETTNDRMANSELNLEAGAV